MELSAAVMLPVIGFAVAIGLAAWKYLYELQQKKLEELRGAIAIGIQEAGQGKVAPFNEEMVERIKARHREHDEGGRERVIQADSSAQG